MSIPKTFWVWLKNWVCLIFLGMLKTNFESADGLGSSVILIMTHLLGLLFSEGNYHFTNAMEWIDFWKSIFMHILFHKILLRRAIFNKRLFQIRIRLTLSGMLNKQLFSLKPPPRDFFWENANIEWPKLHFSQPAEAELSKADRRNFCKLSIHLSNF